jgi:hypothetical protein
MMAEINPPCSPNLSEATAAQLAITLASSLKLNKVIIEGDSQTVISAMIQPDISQDWHISPSSTTLLIPSRLAFSGKLEKSIEV